MSQVAKTQHELRHHRTSLPEKLIALKCCYQGLVRSRRDKLSRPATFTKLSHLTPRSKVLRTPGKGQSELPAATSHGDRRLPFRWMIIPSR